MDVSNRTFRGAKKQRMALGLLSIFLVLVMVAAACGEAATPTSTPATSVPATSVPPTSAPAATSVPPTAVPAAAATTAPAQAATATPGVSSEAEAPTAVPPTPEPTMRLRSEWTPENPATLEEIEAELEKHRGESVTFVSAGGAYQAAERRAWLDPLREKFGIEIIEDSPQPSVAQTRSNAETGNIQWDIIDMGGAGAAALLKTDSLGEYDRAIVDDRDLLDIFTAQGPYLAGGAITWSTVLAYNTDVYPGDTGPKTWADFFDLEQFPGRRALRNAVAYGGQIQIQRLGREPDLLYSQEGRRAVAIPTQEEMIEDFAWFDEWTDEAGSDIIYWSLGSDCPEFLLSGQVSMCSAWNGRIFDAQQTGEPIAVCWECGFMTGISAFTLAKGLEEQYPEKYELANLILAWITFPENNVRIAQFITYGPGNAKSFAFMDDPAYDSVRDELPTSGANISYAILWDETWLAANTDWAGEQFEQAIQ